MKIFIGCSSHEKIKKIYKDTTDNLAENLAQNNNDLLIGGTDGLMGRIISTFNNYKRNIEAICVKNYYDNIDPIYNKYICNTVNDRKNYIIKNTDIFIFLPGGIGTIDEIFTAIETKRANQHNKPIIIVNTNGYYNSLKQTLDKTYIEKFADNSNKELYKFIDKLSDIYKYIERSDTHD